MIRVRNVRETDDFKNAYAAVFGKPFQPLIPKMKVNMAHLKESLSHWTGVDKVKKGDLPEIVHASARELNKAGGE